MEKIIDNPKQMIWTNTGTTVSVDDFEERTFDEIKEMLDDISVKFPINRLRLVSWDWNEDYHTFMIEKESLETDEEYEIRLKREEIAKVNRENAKKLAEVTEYNNYLKLKEKYEKENAGTL